MQRATPKMTGAAQADPGTGAAAGQVSPAGRWSRLTIAVPPALTLAVALWSISASSYWRDEAATLAAVHRSYPQLLRLLGFVDAVHGLYYSIIWVVVRLFGIGEVAVRLPSALAMAAAAAGVAVLGRRLVSARAGLVSGLIFAVLPNVSWYAQDARSPALVTAIAVWTTYLFLRGLDAAGKASSRRWLIGYGAGLVLLGLANVFALLLIVAHALTLAIRARSGGIAWRPLALRWLAAAGTSIVLLSPFLLLARKESWQIRWTPRPGWPELTGLSGVIGPAAMFAVAVLIVGVATALSAQPGRDRTGRRWISAIGGVCLPWLLLPPLILLAASQVKPMYEFRYVVFCVPAAALLVGAALVALGQAVAGRAAAAGQITVVAGVVALAALSLPAQLALRAQAGHGDNIRQLQRIVAANSRPGDVVFYQTDGAGTFAYAYAYGYGLSALPVINQRTKPTAAGTLTGWRWPDQTVQRLLRGRDFPRLWVIGLNRPQPVTLVTGSAEQKLAALPYHRHRAWQLNGIWVMLFVR